jgi:hypothetical protein
MKTVIFGLAKSGTTALFFKIKNSLRPDTVCLFEPRSFERRSVMKKTIKSTLSRRPEPDILAKVLPFRPHNPADVDSFSHFERKVLIVRDPRDRLISRLLYGIYDSELCRHDHKVKVVLELLEQKQKDPKSVPLKTFLKRFAMLNEESFTFEGWANAHVDHSIRKPLDFCTKHEDLFIFSYEDMIDRKFRSLEEYLEVPLRGDASVAQEFDRVRRTMSYGGWRDWLTAEDVEYLRPVMQPFLDRHYPDSNWELSSSPSILAEHGSRYVERIVNERRAILKLSPFAFRSGSSHDDSNFCI